MEKEIVIKNDMAEVIRITRFIEQLGISLLIPAGVIISMRIALEEAISSIIRQAYPTGRQSQITLKSSFINGEITFLIVDDGVSFDPTQEKETPASTSVDEMLSGGLGFFMIFHTMDEVTYHSDGSRNYLMMTKRLEASESPKTTLKTNICKVENVIIFTLNGRLDTANAREFEIVIQPQLKNNSTDVIIINCEWLTYISSSGLRSFILLQKNMSARRGCLLLKSLRPEIRKIFDMTGCTALFTIR